ncbi:MAG: hypothetical protein JW741_23885 [Sedimentisphaerales bacterium]|nr:hypothetical protein [Sedimentisphaerales bacterium]
MHGRLTGILSELRSHAPFTFFGAATGVVCMLIFKNVGSEVSHRLFQVFHPAHVVLSAMVTASLYALYQRKRNVLAILLVGYVGAVGVATLSDCILPFFGESLLGVAIPVHGHSHEATAAHEHEADDPAHADEAEHAHEEVEAAGHQEDDHDVAAATESHEGPRIHLGFIEDWYLVNPAAVLGVLIAFFLPRTKFPHAGHVLISTWASSFHVLMNTHTTLSPVMLAGILIVLFVAVWLPCCISDIVFPMLFVGPNDVHIGHHHHHHGPEASS